jgi:C-terminal processing protease CtpA/Prc
VKYLQSSLFLGLAVLSQAAYADLSVQQRVEDFEFFWQTYKNAYVFFDLKREDHGVDWDQVHTRFLSELKNSTSDLDLYRAVSRAQSTLQDGHCYNGAFSKIRETESVYFQRIQFKLAEERKIAVAVVPEGSVFAGAGVEVGDELVKFDGKTIRQLAERQRAFQSASSENMFWNSFAGQLYIYDPLAPGGKPSAPKATLVFRKPSGELLSVRSDWNAAPPTGKQEAPMGFAGIPEEGVQLTESEKIAIEGPLPMDVRIFRELNLGYLAISTWMKTDDPIDQMEAAMAALKDTDGLIIDMRNNGGGVGTWGVLFANYFIGSGEKTPNDSWMERKLSKAFFRASFSQLTEEQLEEVFTSPETIHQVLTQAFGLEITLEEVKTKHFKDGRFQPYYLHMGLNDRTNTIPAYDKPVYVLSNGGCFSTTDIFMTILDEFQRITVVGSPNGAGSGSPIPFQLPNSQLTVYVPHARAYPAFGSMIEGRPLQVKIPAPPTMEDMKKGRDTTLNAAVKALWEDLHGPLNAVEGEAEFDVGLGESLLAAPAPKVIDWGNIPTPDWAIEAKVQQIKLRNLNLK